MLTRGMCRSCASERRHPFEGVATDSDECARLIAALGPRALTVTLDNHGVVACGHTLPHALRNLWLYTKACTYQVRTLLQGRRRAAPHAAKAVVDATIVREADNQANMDGLGETEFAAWTRVSVLSGERLRAELCIGSRRAKPA